MLEQRNKHCASFIPAFGRNCAPFFCLHPCTQLISAHACAAVYACRGAGFCSASGHEENEICVCMVLLLSLSRAERDAHTKSGDGAASSFFISTKKQTASCCKRTLPLHMVFSASTHTHTLPYVIHCHRSKSMAARNPFQLGWAALCCMWM